MKTSPPELHCQRAGVTEPCRSAEPAAVTAGRAGGRPRPVQSRGLRNETCQCVVVAERFVAIGGKMQEGRNNKMRRGEERRGEERRGERREEKHWNLPGLKIF